MEQAAAVVSSELNWPLSKMATGQLPSPGDNWPATAVCCVYCSVPRVPFSVETSEITSSHCVSADSNCSFPDVSQAKGKAPPATSFVSLKSLSSLSPWWASTLTSALLGPKDPLLSFFSPLYYYVCVWTPNLGETLSLLLTTPSSQKCLI